MSAYVDYDFLSLAGIRFVTELNVIDVEFPPDLFDNLSARTSATLEFVSRRSGVQIIDVLSVHGAGVGIKMLSGLPLLSAN